MSANRIKGFEGKSVGFEDLIEFRDQTVVLVSIPLDKRARTRFL